MSRIIEFEAIDKTYEVGTHQVRALRGINLNIEEGEYVAIMGPSGSGKSTLMNIIGCLDTPTAGIYKLAGERVDTMTDNELADVRNRRIGFVFQTFNLLPRADAYHNVELPLVYAGLPKAQRQEMAEVALAKVGLDERMHHKPNELSGGQRQRVAVARALVNNPSLLLADEPTGNLDSKTSYEIMELFGKLHDAGNTIVLVTHEEDIALYAHRVVRLLDGRIYSDERQEPKDAKAAKAQFVQQMEEE
ncbi:ATP-binding cassette domain-containing protein [bacterium]|nr:ATP-binding cassette domain-containing protein [bacterium]